MSDLLRAMNEKYAATQCASSAGSCRPARTQGERAPLVNAIGARGAKFNDAQRKLRAVLTGN
jgi:hypothetical protein